MSIVRFPAPPTGADDVNSNNQTSASASSPYPPMPSGPAPTVNSSSPSSSSLPVPAVKLTARSCLYELCAASHWKPPTFDCCNNGGPGHQRAFIYKVTVEIKEGLTTMVECTGKPQPNKKSAADSAAEGLLWYLKHLGYPKRFARSKKFR